jgi:hypothetical protein
MKRQLLFLSTLLFFTWSHGQVVITSQVTPAVLVPGQNFVASFTYTSTVMIPAYQIQLYNTLANGDIDYSTGSSVDIYLGNFYTGSAPAPFPAGTVLPITATPSTITFNGFVRANLPLGTNYKWFVKLAPNTGNDTGAAFGTQTAVTVSAPLATDEYSISNSEIYVNSLTKSVVVNRQNIKSDSAQVFDLSGRSVARLANLQQNGSFDLSGLGSGVYFLVTNDRRNFKFVL